GEVLFRFAFDGKLLFRLALNGQVLLGFALDGEVVVVMNDNRGSRSGWLGRRAGGLLLLEQGQDGLLVGGKLLEGLGDSRVGLGTAVALLELVHHPLPPRQQARARRGFGGVSGAGRQNKDAEEQR